MEGFGLCGWQIASATRPELSSYAAAAEAHRAGTFLLNSCQRLEVYRPAHCSCEAPHKKDGRDALQHFAEVAAGLHSVVLGEEQILGQARQAAAAAPSQMASLCEHAIAAARDLRRETEFSTHTGHLLDRALRLADVEPGGSLVVVGAGNVGRLVAQRARELGFTSITVVARRLPDAAWFSEGGFGYVPLHDLHLAPAADVAVTCLGSGAAELVPAELPPVGRLIVDLGTPRNLAPGAAAPVITIAEMVSHRHERRHGGHRRTELRARLAAILDRRLDMAAADSSTPAGRLRREVERVRQAELERTRRLHPELPPETLDRITRALVNQIFHAPSQRLKAVDDPRLARELADLFAPPGEVRE